MRTYLVAFILSALAAFALTPLVRVLAIRIGAVDEPDARRVNKRAIPRLGGVAIILGFFAPLVALFFYDNDVADLVKGNAWRVITLLGGAAVMALVGTLDDIRSLGAWRKLAAQVLVASVAFAAGFQIDAVSLPVVGVLQMGIFAYPITVLWIVGIVNAMNLIDGLDGLAAGVALSACAVIAVMGLISESVLVALVALSLAGALLGFLVFNFNPARIFMGDSGSLAIGFVLATTSLLGAKKATAVALLVPVLALGLPIMDTLLAIVRRSIERRPLFSPDKSHLHHRLISLGLTQRRAVLLLYGVTGLFATAAILAQFGKGWQLGTALLIAAGVLIGLVRVSGGLGALLTFGARQQELPESVERLRRALPQSIAEIMAAREPTALTSALTSLGERGRLVKIELALGGAVTLDGWHWTPAGNGTESLSQRAVPLKAKLLDNERRLGQLRVELREDARVSLIQAQLLVQLIADTLADKVLALRLLPDKAPAKLEGAAD